MGRALGWWNAVGIVMRRGAGCMSLRRAKRGGKGFPGESVRERNLARATGKGFPGERVREGIHARA
ncbi:MAG: hypothetical protein AMXMBFR47_41940 [Planctomycetota bacterium]